MINLKMPKGETDEVACAGPGEGNPYPWGVRITIEDKHLDELNLNAKIGDTVEIHAKAEIVSTSAHEDAESDQSHKSMSFQITDIDVKRPGKSAMSVMYGSEDE